MKIKFFKKEKNFKKDRMGLWLNINFYWKIAVSFMFVVALFSLFFGYSLFVRINKESPLVSSRVSGQVETVKKERIGKVLEYFSLRKKKSDQILVSPAPVIDPSL